jgi:type II restriction/modification system DNA methylase subunit YeeA
VDVIIGNPPFLGGNKIRAELGNKYVDNLFELYQGRVPAFADLVCYWFEKARTMIEEGKTKRAGLLATNSIRGGANRKVLASIKQTGDIFWAQSDHDWILNGASVRVSMIGFDDGRENDKFLDDKKVDNINPDLSFASNATQARILSENALISFQGPSPKAPFDISEELAKEMLAAPKNPNGRSNSDVVRPVLNAADLSRGSRKMWTIDFGLMDQNQAVYYEMPFEYVKENVLPVRQTRRDDYRGKWWQYARPRPEMRAALAGKGRYIATQRHSKHRIFIWVEPIYLCNDATIVFAREDDYFLGVLHSKPHIVWSLKLGTSLEDRPRYTPTTSFETFPFPWPPGQEPKDDPRVQAIAHAAKELVEQRDRWLNPQVTVTFVDDSDRKTQAAEVTVTSSDRKKRTLTNLYNARPTWLDLAHRRLDEAVFAAYGWHSDLSDEEILEKLLALNLERAK